MPADGIGGIAASDELVVVTSRDINDSSDLIYILDPSDGGLIYKHQYKAAGRLDYGNSPRATPVIGPELVYVQGAFGHLVAIDPTEGKVRWQHHYAEHFQGETPTWGFCASPLLVNDQLIVQPNGSKGSVVSLDVHTGQTRWSFVSEQAMCYASPSLLQLPKRSKSSAESANESVFVSETLVVVCDQLGLVGLSLDSGTERWRLRPQTAGEFMVPTPAIWQDWLFWMGEANGLRAYRHSDARASLQIVDSKPELVAQNPDVASDIHTPTPWQGWVVSVDRDLVVLDPASGLTIVDRCAHKSLDGYATIMTEQDRALVCCTDGTILLLQLQDGKLQLSDQQQPGRNQAPVLAQPAMVGGQLYLRHDRSLACYSLND